MLTWIPVDIHDSTKIVDSGKRERRKEEDSAGQTQLRYGRSCDA